MQMAWIMYTLDLSHCHIILSLTLTNSFNPKPKKLIPLASSLTSTTSWTLTTA